MSDVTTIDCRYLDQPRFAAAYMVREGNRATFIETNTARAVPRLLTALESEGLGPDQVDYVIVTHAHLDHAGGGSALMKACPNATLLCHPRAHPHLVDPSKLVASATQVYGAERFAKLYGEIEPIDPARVRALRDSETLGWGERRLRFLHTRGHANHHFCVLDSRSNAIFTGDAFGLVYPALQRQGRVAIPSTSPTDFDAEAARASLQRIVDSGASRAYLTHFGEVDDLRTVASLLDGQLQRYGDTVQQALASNVNDEELDAFCEQHVRTIMQDTLDRAGLGNDEAAHALLATDLDLNAQGVAFAVRKARFKATQG